jgi:hypothetical protein
MQNVEPTPVLTEAAVLVPQKPINFTSALISGTGAAVIAGLIWFAVVYFTHYQIGYVAVAVGFLIGFGTRLGAGGTGSIGLQVLSLGLTLLCLTVSNYEIDRQVAVQYLSGQGVNGNGLSALVNQMMPLVPTPQLLVNDTLDTFKNTPMTILFWGIALWSAWKQPAANA